MKKARERIKDFLKIEKESDRAEERADGYFNSMRYFKAFLDERHSNIPKEWQGKAVSTSYLITAFQNWMRKRQKANGEPYKQSTIQAYTHSFKNSVVKLKLDNLSQTDLFYISTPAEFKEIYQMITSAPDFNEVDLAARNKAFSNVLVLYNRFLKDQENQQASTPASPSIKNDKKRYWMYAPGEGSHHPLLL